MPNQPPAPDGRLRPHDRDQLGRRWRGRLVGRLRSGGRLWLPEHQIGRIIMLAYFDAYTKMVAQLGGAGPEPAVAPLHWARAVRFGAPTPG